MPICMYSLFAQADSFFMLADVMSANQGPRTRRIPEIHTLEVTCTLVLAFLVKWFLDLSKAIKSFFCFFLPNYDKQISLTSSTDEVVGSVSYLRTALNYSN